MDITKDLKLGDKIRRIGSNNDPYYRIGEEYTFLTYDSYGGRTGIITKEGALCFFWWHIFTIKQWMVSKRRCSCI